MSSVASSASSTPRLSLPDLTSAKMAANLSQFSRVAPATRLPWRSAGSRPARASPGKWPGSFVGLDNVLTPVMQEIF